MLAGDYMKIFMLGWEFPPFISGGLGTACYGLTRAMDQLGMEVMFVLPKTVESKYATHVKLLTPGSKIPSSLSKFYDLKNVKFRTISSSLQPYTTPEQYHQRIEELLRHKQEIRGESFKPKSRPFISKDYGGDMYTEVHRYAAMAAELAENEHFDIVHAHDWMTYPAGIAVAAISGKPLVVHMHSTEFDRSGEHVNQMIYDIEREGMRTTSGFPLIAGFRIFRRSNGF